jgi:uncharacterized protein
MADRQGVEIDYCPQCRGVWLDRGELDKILERSAVFTKPRKKYDDEDRRREFSEHRTPEHGDHGKKHKKRESFLGNLFDF